MKKKLSINEVRLKDHIFRYIMDDIVDNKIIEVILIFIIFFK